MKEESGVQMLGIRSYSPMKPGLIYISISREFSRNPIEMRNGSRYTIKTMRFKDKNLMKCHCIARLTRSKSQLEIGRTNVGITKREYLVRRISEVLNSF